jgi:signal transduction histidine kinase
MTADPSRAGLSDPAIAEIEERYRQLAELSADAIMISQGGHIVYANAVKFSPQGGSITITVNTPSQRAAKIAVADAGIGVPEEHRERIFERFYQVEPSERATGMGLGLYISRQIIELHGGRIWMEAPASGGSRFLFALPIDGVPSQTE